MRVGVVSKWFNRGQPVVGRYLRSALDALGHETFVLAKPKREGGPQPGRLSREGVWDQARVTEASSFQTPLDEYERWVERNGIEVVFCDQNYQFDEISSLRRRGVRTIGRFVWEHFSAAHVEDALTAYDVVYSLTQVEKRRYRELGIESPYVPWGCHPELLAVADEVERDGTAGSGGEGGHPVRLVFPGGFIGHRKPVGPVIEAFTRTADPRLRLLVKAQVDRRSLEDVRGLIESDERIEILLADQPTDEHLRTIAACDGCVSPARWEGLGLPLYEAIAFGLPAITNDVAPMNEVIEHERNGLLVRSRQRGTARSGIPAYDPDVEDLANQIERLVDDGFRARLAAGARETRAERSWDLTVEGIGALLARAEAVAGRALGAAGA